MEYSDSNRKDIKEASHDPREVKEVARDSENKPPDAKPIEDILWTDHVLADNNVEKKRTDHDPEEES